MHIILFCSFKMRIICNNYKCRMYYLNKKPRDATHILLDENPTIRNEDRQISYAYMFQCK